MNRKTLFVIFLLALGHSAPALGTPLRPITVITGVGFEGPESARYDELRDEYLVSNLGPREPGSSGFISRLAPDGTLIELRWISGDQNGVILAAPLGIYLKDDLLYVADTKAVVIFDRRSGALLRSIEVSDALRLNDLVVDDDGTIYVTDSGSSSLPGAIYKISGGGEVSFFAPRDSSLERPNGIALDANGDIVHGGRGVNIVVRGKDGGIIREQTLPNGQFDGIVRIPNGDLLVASQLGRNVYRVPADGSAVSVVAENLEAPAAIGFDPKRMRLLVPQIRAGSLTIFGL